MHDVASVWNAGFIRQVCNRRVLLPDESDVPVVVSRCVRQRGCERRPVAFSKNYAILGGTKSNLNYE
jgi:hypothetical protein